MSRCDESFHDEENCPNRYRVFTASDLKRLKEGKSHITHIGVDTPLFKALLARLEAAEKVLLGHEHELSCADPVAFTAWRKSKGER